MIRLFVRSVAVLIVAAFAVLMVWALLGDRRDHLIVPGTRLEHPGGDFDGVVSDEEIAMAEDLLRSDPVTAQVLATGGASIGEWASAVIEGENRAMFTEVRFDEPIVTVPTVIQVDREAVLRDRFPRGVVDYIFPRTEIGVLDPDSWYPLERAQRSEQTVEAYMVIVDLPTERILSFKVWPAPPPFAPGYED